MFARALKLRQDFLVFPRHTDYIQALRCGHHLVTCVSARSKLSDGINNCHEWDFLYFSQFPHAIKLHGDGVSACISDLVS